MAPAHPRRPLPPEDQTSPENPWPLSAVETGIQRVVSGFSQIWIEGEVGSYQARPGARVQFFQLRDLEENMAMTVKAFANAVPAELKKGDRIVILAKPDLYTVSGQLSLHADQIRYLGLGQLLARLRELEKRLEAEGLFDPAHKKPIPFLPTYVGLICGRNTKAKEDVLANVAVRWPGVRFAIREVPVQGAGAAGAIRQALAELDSLPEVDVIILARGGGSDEDLLPFSEEALIRDVFAAHTPVISAIGHEGDRPLLDRVADVRASTPTDAARKVVPSWDEQKAIVTQLRANALRLAQRSLPDITPLRAALDRFQPRNQIMNALSDLALTRTQMDARVQARVTQEESRVGALAHQLRALSPLDTLARGYSIVTTPDGAVVSNTEDIHVGDALTARLHHGTLSLNVQGVHHAE